MTSRVCENPYCGASLDGERQGKRHCNSSCRAAACRYAKTGGDSASERFWDQLAHIRGRSRTGMAARRREATR